MVDPTSVTVAVPVLNRRDRMLRCLDAILALEYPSYEVLILDNGSTDGTTEACRERAAAAPVPVRVERVEGQIGRVRNTAVRLAAGEIVAFTDSDCLPDRGWLAAGVQPFQDPAVGVVTGTTLPEQSPPYGAGYASREITEQTWRFQTCNALFRRSALLASDGFDETVKRLWDDTAAGWALMREGWKAEFVPEALVYHDVTYPGFWWHVRRSRGYGEGARLLRRYPEMRRTLMFARYFGNPPHALALVALTGVALSPLSRRALALALPYVLARRPRALTRGALYQMAQFAACDLAELEGMMRGWMRTRR